MIWCRLLISKASIMLARESRSIFTETSSLTVLRYHDCPQLAAIQHLHNIHVRHWRGKGDAWSREVSNPRYRVRFSTKASGRQSVSIYIRNPRDAIICHQLPTWDTTTAFTWGIATYMFGYALLLFETSTFRARNDARSLQKRKLFRLFAGREKSSVSYNRLWE